MGLGWLLDFNSSLGREFNTVRAWVVLLAVVISIGLACAGIAGVEAVAHCLGVPSYFTAHYSGGCCNQCSRYGIVRKDALKGDYDDALANAIGSTYLIYVFVSVCLCWCIPFVLALRSSRSAVEIQLLQWMLLVVT